LGRDDSPPLAHHLDTIVAHTDDSPPLAHHLDTIVAHTDDSLPLADHLDTIAARYNVERVTGFPIARTLTVSPCLPEGAGCHDERWNESQSTTFVTWRIERKSVHDFR